MNAIFVMEPIGVGGTLEANGTVFHFCSEDCRTQFQSSGQWGALQNGVSVDAIDGTVCDQCGAKVNTPPKDWTNGQYQEFRIGQGPSLLRSLRDVIVKYGTDEGTELDCAIRDALTDLRHLCDIHSLDFGEIDGKAYDGYLEETSPEWRSL